MEIPFVNEPKDPISALQFFIHESSQVHGQDYGDCMREWNRDILFLKHCWLRDQASTPVPQAAFQKLEAIQNYVQFTPNWNVQATRLQILKDAHEIEKIL